MSIRKTVHDGDDPEGDDNEYQADHSSNNPDNQGGDSNDKSSASSGPTPSISSTFAPSLIDNPKSNSDILTNQPQFTPVSTMKSTLPKTLDGGSNDAANSGNNGADNQNVDPSLDVPKPYDPTGLTAGVIFLIVAYLVFRYMRSRMQQSQSSTPNEVYTRVPQSECSGQDIELGKKIQNASADDDTDEADWDSWQNDNFNTSPRPVSTSIDKLSKSSHGSQESRSPPKSAKPDPPSSIVNSSNHSSYNSVTMASSSTDRSPSPSTATYSLNASNNARTTKAKVAPAAVKEDVDLFASIGMAAKPTFHQPAVKPATAVAAAAASGLVTAGGAGASKLHSLMNEVDSAAAAGNGATANRSKWNEDLDDDIDLED